MLHVKYFASLREALECAEEALVDAPVASETVAALKSRLAARGGAWVRLVEQKNLRVAVNQDMANDHTSLGHGDEVAFFPPVTGG